MFDLVYLHAPKPARVSSRSLIGADDDEANQYERLLITLDRLEPDGPATWPISADRAAMLGLRKATVDQLIRIGAGPRPLDLVWPLANSPITAK